MALTKRQHQVLAFIINYVREHEYAPSIREIAQGLGVASPATVHEHLESLRQSGYLAGSGSRACLPTRATLGIGKAFELPLLGTIAAGAPIEAVETREAIAVPADFVVDGMNSYVLRVRGDSMIEEGIFDGDYVVVERNPSPKNGEVVVALLDNAFATLKKFYRERGRIRLQPANATMRPIFVRDCIVQGVVRAVIRKYAAA
ncbi:transcriptional repressor LexA [Candidatus Uhrbacteria bacterium]|nr:transcriptional repressor LexA [Candidatus Uhrbacteria bacterium]